MKAVVMAGGEGTRLRPLTSNQPKPMVPIVNKPCAQHIVELLARNQIDQIVMTLAFLPNQIRDYFGDGSDFGVRIKYSVEETPAGTAGSVLLAREALDDTFLVISGDALTDFNLTELIDFHREHGALVTIALKSVPNPLEFGVVMVDDDGRIQRFLEKPGWGQVFSDTVNTGIYVVEPEVFDHIPKNRPYDFSRELFPSLFAEHQALYGCVCEGYWQDIGSLEQYLQANRDALDGKVRVTPPGVRLRGNIWVARNAEVEALDGIVGPAVIGEDVRIDPSAQLRGHTVIGDHAVLRAGCRLEGSVLGENVYMASGAVVAGAVLCNGAEIRENAHLAQGAVVGERTTIGRGAVVANNVKVYPFKSVEPGSIVRSSLVWESRAASTLFGNKGVRGVANVDLTSEVALRLAMAYGTMLDIGSSVTLSRDSHGCSRVLHQAMASGLNATGLNVRDLGVATLAINRSDLNSGKVTASIHVQMTSDAPDHMEILFSEAPGVPIDSNRERSIENHYSREDFRRAPYDRVGEVIHPLGALETYTTLLFDNWDVAVIRDRAARVVLDMVAPSSADFVPTLFERLGLEIITVTTPRTATPPVSQSNEVTPAAKRVGEIVRTVGADMGVILDTGAERLILVDENGKSIEQSALMLTLLRTAAEQGDSGTVVLPQHATSWAERVVEASELEIRRAKCSDNALLSDSLRPGTLFVANTEGGFAYPGVLPAMDAVYAFGKILELFACSDLALSQILAKTPATYISHRTQECPWHLKGVVMREITSRLATERVSLVDGVKVFVGKNDWVLVLPDSEGASFHLYAEADSKRKSAALLERYRQMLESAIVDVGGRSSRQF